VSGRAAEQVNRRAAEQVSRSTGEQVNRRVAERVKTGNPFNLKSTCIATEVVVVIFNTPGEGRSQLYQDFRSSYAFPTIGIAVNVFSDLWTECHLRSDKRSTVPLIHSLALKH
jgi:hypothetical protein